MPPSSAVASSVSRNAVKLAGCSNMCSQQRRSAGPSVLGATPEIRLGRQEPQVQSPSHVLVHQ